MLRSNISLRISWFFLVGLLLMIFIVSCGQARSTLVPDGKSLAKTAVDQPSSDTSKMPENQVGSNRTADNAQARVGQQNRKRVVTGQIELQVSDLDSAMTFITKANDGLGGYIAANTLNGGFASLTLRIPAEQYSALLEKISKLGKVISSETHTDDVSDSWYDLDTRLKAKRILLERYLSYLRQAKSVEDLMAIERQVNETSTEVEQLEASFRNLDNQVAYSSLAVALHLPGSPEPNEFDLGNALWRFLQDLGHFFQNLLVWTLYFIFFGAPLALIAVLLFWVLFGRIGLLRRLFTRVGAKRNTP